jgi:hypothetical protein
MSGETLAKIIDVHLNGHGAVIVEEAKRAGLELALASALVEQESGGYNVFGHDYPMLTADTPPYYGHPVTKERVAALRASRYQNGCGLPQLTYDPFLAQADMMGGAHIPRYQCQVGFGLLAGYIARYEYYEALGAYNAGEEQRHTVRWGYAAELADKHETWKSRLNEEEGKDVTEYPTAWLRERGWQTDGAGRYARVNAPTKVLVNPEGWQYAMPISPEPPVHDNGTWMQRHPTRYTWRQDVEEMIIRILSRFPDVRINTYVDHPEGWGLDTLSYDVWGPAGRGDPVGTDRGQKIFDYIFNDTVPPSINWAIFRGWLWSRAGGWARYGDSADTVTDSVHEKHIHVTCL